MFRTTLSRFSILGSLQSRPVEVTVDPVAVEGVRGVFVAADRPAAIAAAGGYQVGRSYALPDVSGGVSVAFEEVYPI